MICKGDDYPTRRETLVRAPGSLTLDHTSTVLVLEFSTGESVKQERNYTIYRIKCLVITYQLTVDHAANGGPCCDLPREPVDFKTRGRPSACRLRCFADEVCSIIRAAGSFVGGDLGVRTKRSRAVHSSIREM
jgi:hypothetical protein